MALQIQLLKMHEISNTKQGLKNSIESTFERAIEFWESLITTNRITLLILWVGNDFSFG